MSLSASVLPHVAEMLCNIDGMSDFFESFKKLEPDENTSLKYGQYMKGWLGGCLRRRRTICRIEAFVVVNRGRLDNLSGGVGAIIVVIVHPHLLVFLSS